MSKINSVKEVFFDSVSLFVQILNKGLRNFLKSNIQSLWRNWLARSAVNRKVDGSNPSRDDIFFLTKYYFSFLKPLEQINSSIYKRLTNLFTLFIIIT